MASAELMPKTRIAVIGAGMAGIACAQDATARGFRPAVFEKGRGLGGRLATRRADDGSAFDHGAQYLTARSAALQALVRDTVESGAAALWRPRDADRRAPAREDWFVGTPAMNALVKPLARGLDIRLETQVTAVERDGGGWRLRTLADPSGAPFDVVVSTTPAPQARALFAFEPGIARALDEVAIAPCWALMLTFAKTLDCGFDVRRSETADLAWIARNRSKPGRAEDKDCWVVHAGPDWSRHHLERERDEIMPMMIEMFRRALDVRLPEIEHAAAHRWRYARTIVPLGKPYLRSGDGTLFVGGDWCLGARVESAFESGRAMAASIADAANPV